VILDFQSLYPSLMIAYNICYSTCLGLISQQFTEKGHKRVGVSKEMNVDFKALFGENGEVTEEELAKKFIVSPNGVLFVRKETRLGILPQILQEFLNTRIMIKRSMKLVNVVILILIKPS